ncbi:LytS/YhcK type 5TM receptor domain-containing protein [Enterococcus saccharolyticus]|uniref:LytS/YhcK type 5TM receptor domain-containing protein n=1 Tax=Enterococcus saccharolyticus TaxID=41997 RepID=UPI0039E1D573
MFELFILMMERVGLIILLAFLLVNVTYFKRTLLSRETIPSKIRLVVIFGLFAIISNFTGIEITDNQIIPSHVLTYLSSDASIANTRTLVISVSGLIGGPFVGGMVGLIAGIHRVIQGAGTGIFYIPASLVVGIVSGILGKRLAKDYQFPKATQAAMVGIVMEVIQMLFILFFSGSLKDGVMLVRFIALPMILLNSVGTFIFLSILTTTLKQEEQAKAVQTHDVLELAAETLPYFREGLNEHSCQKVARIIQHYTKVSAISMTDNHQILAHVGAGDDHHIPELEVITELSKEVLRTGKMTIAHSKTEVGCSHPDCPLQAAIVIPLLSHQKIVGTLKMYFTDPTHLTHVEEQLAEGLGTIFSSQIELGEAELQSKLLKEAEIKSLQAQVNPHFFFNAINTISALMRKDSENARRLLLQLSTYFRGNLQGAVQTTIPLEQELDQVRAYLSLEQARFPDRYQVDFDIEAGTEGYYVPPYAIQVLVENTIRHAFGNRKTNNHVKVVVRKIERNLIMDVWDNGIGIPEDRRVLLGREPVKSEKGTGTALENLSRRIENLYGGDGKFQIENRPTGGSHARLAIPIRDPR